MEKEKNNEIEIGKTKSEDFEGIQEVYYFSFKDAHVNEEAGITEEDIDEFFKNRFSEKSREYFLNQIENPDPNHKVFIARVNGKIVGVCRFKLYDDYNQLQAIYVLPKYHGKGVAQKLWEAGMKEIGKDKKIIVHTATFNIRAQKFYEKLGFKDNGKRFSEERHRMPISKVLIPEMEMELTFD